MTADDSGLDELARSAQSGDALARLLRAVRPHVYRWAVVQTASPDDAEDITQQALIRVHAHIGQFSFGARFMTWLYSITRHAAADWRRTHRRRSTLLAEHLTYAGNPEMAASDSSLVTIVRAQLGSLTGRQRELFDLIDLQGYTPAEAADLLGIEASTARVHVLRARRAIRSRILAAHPELLRELT